MRKHIICIVCFLVTLNTYIQGQDPALLNYDDVSTYINTLNDHSIIYTGKEEPRNRTKTLNHPYLITDEYRKGTLSFEGRVYPDIMLRLNQNISELIVLSPKGNLPVVIPRERLDYAVIDSFYIVYQKPLSLKGLMLPEGYYIRTYNGKCQVWNREVFFLSYFTEYFDLFYTFESTKRIYIVMDGVYYPVKNKRSVLKLFASRKKEIKEFIKQTGLSFRDNQENAIIAIAGYYDKLTK